MSSSRVSINLANEMTTVDQSLDMGSHSFFAVPKKNRDYCQLLTSSLGLSFGICEIQGLRPTQEDCVSVSAEAVMGINEINVEAQELIFLSAFKELQERYGNNLRTGSTACVATAWVDLDGVLRVLTANLGDSSAYYVVLNRDNKLVSSNRLNTLHQPWDFGEQYRIIHSGGRVENGRLNAELALTRAFGDARFDNVGISHIPDIRLFSSPLADGEHAYIVVACDGMDDIENEVGKVVAEHHHTGLTGIANALVRAAFAAGSEDNISVVVFEPRSIPASAAVFDGHGGASVANQISENFYSVLAATIKNLQDPGCYEDCKQQLENERVLRERAIVTSRRTKESNLQRIKNKLEYHLRELKITADFHVYSKFIHEIDPWYTVEKEYVLVFQTGTHFSVINEIESLAAEHHQRMCYFGPFSRERAAHQRRFILSFTENEEIPTEFDAFIGAALELLESRKLISRIPVVSCAEQCGLGLFSSRLVLQQYIDQSQQCQDVNKSLKWRH
jgi:serine/threonine protein phosphatase PrpC